jgi:sulfoxide reductase catalytic subunit YedY
MLIKKPDDIPENQITPPEIYFNRRTFMRAALLAGTALGTGLVYRKLNPSRSHISVEQPALENVVTNTSIATTEAATTTIADAGAGAPAALPGDLKLTSYKDITNYNNFYEFSTEKERVADAAADFVARPWTVSVGGLCAKPKEFDIDDLLKISPPEERVYRMRCVERWSMVVPWDGFSLSKLLERVQPNSSAKYVAFTTLLDSKRMPNQNSGVLNWPYVEGLRMDEAMHPLAILASGLYRKQLPPQDGAPIRLVTPWKYGFKGIKSIVKIELVENQPPTTWNIAWAGAYGFYANVNPNVPHPSWSQDSEFRIGENGHQKTLLFNGYSEQVASMYAGMDLTANY